MPVIVFLKDQPAVAGVSTVRSGKRAAGIQAAQSPYLQQFRQPGDFWELGVAPFAASASFSLFPVRAGQTRTITVTIKPSGPVGTVVRGTLYVDDFAASTQFLSGSQLMALPYVYAIG